MDTTQTPAQQATADACEMLFIRVMRAQAHAQDGNWSAVLAMTAELNERLSTLTDSAACMGREAGASWAAIGSELGMTRQGAEQRFGDFARGFLYA